MLSYSLVLLFLFILAAWTLYTASCLARNYYRARKIGIPLIVLPIDPGNPLWMSIDTLILPFFKHIPYGSGNFTRFNWRGWEYEDRFRAHQELGDAFVLVTPGNNWLQVCNVEALADIFQRRDDFIRPNEMLEMLNIFGPNLGTTEGQQWQRHRKVASACFNERINDLVWSESVQQAAAMLDYWTSKSSIRSVADDTRTLSLHVMSSAGFGKSYPFQGSDEPSSTGGSTSYKDSLKLILDNCIPLVVLGPKNLSKWWLPRRWKMIYQATVTFRNYMTQIYEEEKRAMLHGRSSSNNLVTSLIRASQDMAEAANVDTVKARGALSRHEQGGLTENEIYGNIFLFNFAGHDTTAHTLTFAIVLLATRPDVQDWISGELQYVVGDQKPENSSYSEVFPKLQRCLAVLYETIRLYNPVPLLKSTNSHPQSLKIGDKTIIIPPKTMVIPSYSAMHTHPRHWGADSMTWQPSRWITSTSSTPNKALPGSESLITFPKTASPFIGWSAGEHGCPGRKFSQVEFVAVMAGLFRDWKLKPVPEPGEDDAMARSRIQRLVEKETGMVLLLQMLHPEKAVLTWERR